MNISPDDLWAQYQAGHALWPWFDDIERQYGLTPCLLWAVGSRETSLTRKYAEGQVHHDGHGWGLFGADDRWNDLPAGFSTDPDAQARLAATTLRRNYDARGTWVDAVNAYGPQWARGYAPENYGPDVLARAAHIASRTRSTAPMAFYSRSDWGARAPRATSPAPGMTRGIGLHHLGDGWGPTGGVGESLAKMRWVQDFHMGPSRGWADFAYNAAVDHLGNVFAGRGPRVRNAANGGGTRHGYDSNAGWFSILYLAGSSGPNLTPAAKDGVWAAAEWGGVAGGEWLGHGDFLGTECPGADRFAWLRAGHPRGNTTPEPTPQPEPDPEVTDMFIFDGPPERGGGVYYTDGYNLWGVPNEASLAFFATGKVPHLGRLPLDAFDALRWRDSGEVVGAAAAAESAQVETVGPTLAEAMARSSFETGDPGCAEGDLGG